MRINALGAPVIRNIALPAILLSAVGLLAYGNTFHVPFQMDEHRYLWDNPFVRDIGGAGGLREADPELYKTVVQRFVGYLTFAFNYQLHGNRVAGYHIVNVAIHLMNAVLVYLLALMTFRTPRLAGSALGVHARSIALFTGLLFVAHPVQTEAVTYIMQRLASLAALFSLLSLSLYVRWRLGGGWQTPAAGEAGQTGAPDRGSLWWYAGSVLSAVLAMKTKENTFILPVIILAYELFFFSGEVKKRVARLLPLLATLLIIPATTLYLLEEHGARLATLAAGEAESAAPPWPSYLITQIRAMVTYYRLLLLPVNQNFLHAYPVYDSVFHPEVLLSLGIHLSVVIAGIVLFRRSNRVDPVLRVIPFGILWFYIALSVESGLIALPIMLCEYRLYLPSVGMFAAAVTGVFWVLTRSGARRVLQTGMIALSLLVIGAAAAAYGRNEVWATTVSLWEDTAGKSPGLSWAHTNLGAAYVRWGRYEEAIGELETALRLEPDGRHVFIIHNNLGTAYSETGRPDDAIREFKAALELNPDYAPASRNLALEYARQGRYDEAKMIDPERPAAATARPRGR